MRKTFLLLVVLAFASTLQAQLKQVDWEVIATRADGFGTQEGKQPVAGRLIWGDFNNDGFKDAFLICGAYDAMAALWKNNGDNTFTKIQDGTFNGLQFSAAVFIDYDNDGDLDLVTVGKQDGGENQVYAYKNAGEEPGGYAYELDEERTNSLKNRINVNIGDDNNVGRAIQAVDYNNDGWMDLIVTGHTNYNAWGWNPNNNDGAGNWDWVGWSVSAIAKNTKTSFEIDFTPVNGENGQTNFIYTRSGSVHVGDINKDGYADVLIQGYSDNTNVGYAARLYVNNQDGTFNVHPYSSTLLGKTSSETLFVDLNSDGYDDIVEMSKEEVNIHINNTESGFTKYDKDTNGFIRVNGPSITAGDINNDGWVDLLVSGLNGNDSEFGTTRIFYNNGDNTFTAANVLDNMKARTGSTALVDVNNDGTIDFSNFGWEGSSVALNKLGEGISSNSAPGAPYNFTVTYSDGKYRLSWNAPKDDLTSKAALRYNVYAQNNETGAIYVYAPADIVTGRLKIGGEIVPLIHGTSFDWNLPEGDYTFGVQAIDQADAASQFTVYTAVPVTTWDVIASGGDVIGDNAGGGHLIWGDYDNDGDKDAFFVGGMWTANARLLQNNGDNTFTAVQEGTFQKLVQAGSVFIDYDNDGDLDLVIMGKEQDGPNKAYVYENTGAAGNYAFVLNEAQTNRIKDYAVNTGSGNSAGGIIQAIDYDNDGWMDLVFAGDANYNVYDWDLGKNDGAGDWGWLWGFTTVFKNDNGEFVQKHDLVVNDDGSKKNFDFVRKGSVNVGDVNHDGFTDFLAQGYNDQQGWIARLYINNQDGTFTQSPYSSALNGNEEYETIFADINADGYDDLVEVSRAVANLHINDGNGSFTKYENSGLIKSLGASIAAGDLNNDGLVDLLVSGLDGNDGELGITKLFYNNGDLTFSVFDVPENMRARSGNVSLVDINNDGNLDYANTGYRDGWNTVFALNTLANGTIAGNTTPAAPANLEVNPVHVLSSDYGSGITLLWGAATDEETPTAALRYIVSVTDEDTNTVYTSLPVLTTFIHLDIPEAAVYTFGVQTFDQANVTSAAVTASYDGHVGIKAVKETIAATVSSKDKSIAINNTLASDVTYSIVSANGQTVEQGVCHTMVASRQLAPGVYLVKLSNGNAVNTKKVIVF
ncbi:MAG: T9SS type A sorting domain-containing protein [Candidatus Symbiothrix sp.]|jgi:hypothetical protein|nr:T9SS type A sorting domain-containing protein [Candidatus Symbiothrix sp.]